MYDGIESAAGEPGISNKHKNTKDTIDPIIPKFYKLVHTYYSVY